MPHFTQHLCQRGAILLSLSHLCSNSLLHYFSIFRAVWYGVCVCCFTCWTKLMLFKKGSRSHKKVRLILDYMSHKWLHCQIQGGIIGRREEVGLRHSSEEQNQRDRPFNIKKTWRCCVHDVVLQRLYHNDCTTTMKPIWVQHKLQKINPNLWLMRRGDKKQSYIKVDWHHKCVVNLQTTK